MDDTTTSLRSATHRHHQQESRNFSEEHHDDTVRTHLLRYPKHVQVQVSRFALFSDLSLFQVQFHVPIFQFLIRNFERVIHVTVPFSSRVL